VCLTSGAYLAERTRLALAAMEPRPIAYVPVGQSVKESVSERGQREETYRVEEEGVVVGESAEDDGVVGVEW